MEIAQLVPLEPGAIWAVPLALEVYVVFWVSGNCMVRVAVLPAKTLEVRVRRLLLPMVPVTGMSVPLHAEVALLNTNAPVTIDPLILRPPVKVVPTLLPDVTLST